jgi:hypothetical protein
VIKTGKELAAACEKVAKEYKTLYVLGCFGWPMTAEKKQRAKNAQSYNRKEERAAKINAATADTFGFDCVCLIKALLWGWNGDSTKDYGGATYGSNGVPDIDETSMINACKDVSTNFSSIQIGEAVWLPGHIGVYIGNGLAVECTPIWKDGVQITAVHNIGKKSGYNGRTWTKHGKLPYVTYDKVEAPATTTKVEKPSNLPVLKKGSEGASVKALQILLIGYGYSCGRYGADGDFGGDTDKAVRAYQADRGLEVDGVVGPASWAELLGV